MGYQTDYALQNLVMDMEAKFRIRNAVTTEYLYEAVAYLRYSSHRQDGGVSLEYQISEVLAYAEREKIKITGWYIDTAKTAKEVAGRDDFIRLFDDVERGEIPPNVIIFATNRAFRNNGESYQYRAVLRNKGITLHSATQRIDEKTSSGRLHVNMLATIDQFQSETISDFVSAAMKYLITDGFSAGGQHPYGYTTELVIYNGKERMKMVPFEPEAAVVREIFEGVVAGRNLSQIAISFKERGILTRQGKTFNWSKLRKMLANIVYKGERKYKMKNGEIAYSKEFCTPIVSAELFDAANKIYEKSSSQPKGRMRRQLYPLTGKLACTSCGRTFTGRTSNGYSYYCCRSRQQQIDCKAKQIRKGDLERMAFNAVKEHILSAKAIEDITKKVMKQIKKAPAVAESKKELMAQQATLEREIAEIVQMKLNGSISESVMAMMTAEKNAALSTIGRKLNASKVSTDASIDASYIKKRIRSIFDHNAIFGECSPEVLKELFNQTIKQIEISDAQVVIHLRVPLFDITHKQHNGNPEICLCVKVQR